MAGSAKKTNAAKRLWPLALLGAVALGVLALLFVSLLDDEERPERRVVVRKTQPKIAPSSPNVETSASSHDVEPSPSQTSGDAGHDPRIFDPNGNYREVEQLGWRKITPETWQSAERIAGRSLSASEQKRVYFLTHAYDEDRDVYQRALNEGRYTTQEFDFRRSELDKAMKKRLSEMLNVKKEQGEALRDLLMSSAHPGGTTRGAQNTGMTQPPTGH